MGSAIGQKLKLMRELAGMTRAEFAQKFGVEERMVYLYELNFCRPDEAKLAAIADHFRVALQWLVGPVTSGRESRWTPFN